MQNQQVREEPQKLILHKTKIMIYGINVSIALANCHDRIYLMISSTRKKDCETVLTFHY